MTENADQPSKCKYCGAKTIGSDVCKDCLDNPYRQEEYMKLKTPYTIPEVIASLTKNPRLFMVLMKYYTQTVKRDPVTKAITFLVCLSAYTQDPLNLFLRGESSLGKTYVVTQITKIFPKNDVWNLGGATPKFLIRQHGILVDENEQPILMTQKPDKDASMEELQAWQDRLRNSKMIIDLTGKILVFLEAPHIETFNAIRSILSHDEKEISFPFVNKTDRLGITTVNVVVRGWPACVFCSSSERHVQDLATRSITVTPTFDEKKFRDANKLSGAKVSLPWKYKPNEETEQLKQLIRELKNLDIIEHIIIPYGEKFGEYYKSSHPRDMRDFRHILSLIQTLCLLYYVQRPILYVGNEKNLIATEQDCSLIMALWQQIAETTETGAPGQILKLYKEVILPLSQQTNNPQQLVNIEETKELLINDITDQWNIQNTHSRKSSDTIRNWIDYLCLVGYCTKRKNPDNKKENLVKPIKETNGTYTHFQFADMFSLKNLKQWQKQVETITEKNEINITENLLSTEKRPLSDLESFFFESTIFSVIKTESKQADLAKKDSKIPENQNCVYNLNDTKRLALISHVHTGEPCGNECGKMSQYRIEIDADFSRLFCTECFREAKADLIANGYELKTKGLEAS
jgi:hypothetical protein